MLDMRLKIISVSIFLLLIDASHGFAKPANLAAANTETEQKFLQEKWDVCLKTYAESVAVKNSDPALIVVRAAFTHCQKHEDALFNYFWNGYVAIPDKKQREFGLTWLTKTFFPLIKKHNTDLVIETVMSTRAK